MHRNRRLVNDVETSGHYFKMKKSKSKTKPVRKPAAKSANVQTPEESLKSKFLNLAVKVSAEATEPTTEQLALVAASLAESINNEPSKLVDAAIKLWDAAEKKLHGRLEDKCNEALTDYIVCDISFDKTLRFPLKRDEFLLKMLPRLKYRTGEIASVLKAYAKSEIEQSGRNATPEEVSNYYANWKPIVNVTELKHRAILFHHWWETFHRNKIFDARRSAGKISAFNKKLKKKL